MAYAFIDSKQALKSNPGASALRSAAGARRRTAPASRRTRPPAGLITHSYAPPRHATAAPGGSYAPSRILTLLGDHLRARPHYRALACIPSPTFSASSAFSARFAHTPVTVRRLASSAPRAACTFRPSLYRPCISSRLPSARPTTSSRSAPRHHYRPWFPPENAARSLYFPTVTLRPWPLSLFIRVHRWRRPWPSRSTLPHSTAVPGPRPPAPTTAGALPAHAEGPLTPGRPR